MSEKIYDSTFNTDAATLEKCSDFIAIVRQLRRDCPWDREQTHESVRHLLIEECFETVEAIDKGDHHELKKELGDLLLHVVFNAVIAEQEGTFDFADVLDAETSKLVRRHPHVFGDVKVGGTDEVLQNWEQIKLSEGRRTSVLEGVPSQLPSLLRAYRIQEKAAGVGFDFANASDAWAKVDEELAELREEDVRGQNHQRNGSQQDSSQTEVSDDSRAEEEFGDLLFALVNYARLRGWNPENALRQTNQKFTRRFQYVESAARENEASLSEMSLEQMDVLWDKAKMDE